MTAFKAIQPTQVDVTLPRDVAMRKAKFIGGLIIMLVVAAILAVGSAMHKKDEQIAVQQSQIYRLELDLEYAVNRCTVPLATYRKTQQPVVGNPGK